MKSIPLILYVSPFSIILKYIGQFKFHCVEILEEFSCVEFLKIINDVPTNLLKVLLTKGRKGQNSTYLGPSGEWNQPLHIPFSNKKPFHMHIVQH